MRDEARAAQGASGEEYSSVKTRAPALLLGSLLLCACAHERETSRERLPSPAGKVHCVDPSAEDLPECLGMPQHVPGEDP